MPKEINEKKNTLKAIQLKASTDNGDPSWLISWTPKKDDDGLYPEIIAAE